MKALVYHGPGQRVFSDAAHAKALKVVLVAEPVALEPEREAAAVAV